MDLLSSSDFLMAFALSFVPLFVAMEPIGILPIYVSLTSPLGAIERRHVLSYSVLTAAAITIVFLIIGKGIFAMLGITIADFQIAGGLILLTIAMSEIVPSARGVPEVMPTTGVGIVPIGTPLIAGPAALTTLLMLNDLYGLAVTLTALVANLVIIWIVLSSADTLIGISARKARSASPRSYPCCSPPSP
jgi:multiple antibiotic resistance protein